ncbi:MAG: hypothetical protein GMKNLPBB_03006 [Myxococcota bacterium]|nr:hypothetical protein [Myxococcota bacterium]
MKTASLPALIGANIANSKRNFLLSSIGVTAGVSFLLFFSALGAGLKAGVEQFRGKANLLRVTTKAYNLPFFRQTSSSVITDDSLNRFRALPGVESVGAELDMLPPMQGVGRIFNLGLKTELVATGLDPGLVADDIPPQFRFAWKPDQTEPVPGLVSRTLLQIFNENFASKFPDLPRVNPDDRDAFVNFVLDFDLLLNRSFLVRSGLDAQQIKARVVGTSKLAVLVGVSFPMEFVKHVNRQHIIEQKRREKLAELRQANPDNPNVELPADFQPGEKDLRFSYRNAYIKIQNPSYLPAITAEVESMGLKIDPEVAAAGRAIDAITWVMRGLALLIIALAAVNISQTFFLVLHQRRRDFGILRAIGASRMDLRIIVMGEAFLLGLFGGVTGALIAWLGSRVADFLAIPALNDLLNRYVRQFYGPVTVDSLFAYDAMLIGAGILFAVACALTGAFWPAQRAAQLDPAAALAEN